MWHLQGMGIIPARTHQGRLCRMLHAMRVVIVWKMDTVMSMGYARTEASATERATITGKATQVITIKGQEGLR